ncbi:hypothetical protein Nepgr_000411 [Nepenthes gracilis]|uniref:RING-type domain-containing protein n=1 Tax=Nepenthes gracilis TaxID=150966 RepID=A0AAD3P3T2_NEPGR|nr:hypothetical protein Nepgr_000411 [Nepenthes gracilis]
MPTQKRSPESQSNHTQLHYPHKQHRHDGDDDDGEGRQSQLPPPSPPQQQKDGVVREDSDASDAEHSSGYVHINLQEIRKNVQCPICLGIIKKTRTMMECMHRFCRECIDKSMRLGNNECPACRTHCPSRRSLRDDPRFDAMIASLFPDIGTYEEEELAFHEEEKERNLQIQASIAQIAERQSEARGKKRPAYKDTAGPTETGSQQNCQNAMTRRRRSGAPELRQLDDTEDADNDIEGRQLSSSDEHLQLKKRKRRLGSGSSHPHSLAADSSLFCSENNSKQNRIGQGLSPGFMWNKEIFSWGCGGARSSTRHGSGNCGISNSSKSIRLAKLVDFLRSLEENDEYADLQTSLEADTVELLVGKEPNGSHDEKWLHPSPCMHHKNWPSQFVDP